jgi:hypothetical protein
VSAARLAAGLWVEAYMHRLTLEAIPVYVLHRGDATAGAVMVKLATLDGRARLFARRTGPEGRAWMETAEGPEAEIDASIARQRGFDPDLWVLEIEDRAGRTLLDTPGLE